MHEMPGSKALLEPRSAGEATVIGIKLTMDMILTTCD